MKKILQITILILILHTNIAYATFSQFVHITPATKNKYDIHMQILPVKNQRDKYRIKIPIVSDEYKHTWLIICKNAIKPEKQNFRNYIWSSQHEGRDIIAKARLRRNENSFNPIDSKYIEIVLDKNLMKRAYIYIDFPAIILDGGYYYSIDLSSYLNEAKE